METVTTDDVLSRLSKRTRGHIRLGSEIENRVLPSASLGLNMLVGGFGVGKQSTVWGNESGGKSALMMSTMGLNQKNGVVCGFIDVEKTFDPVWAARLGVDVDKLLISQQSNIGAITDDTIDMIKSGAGMIVLDTTSAAMPGSFYEGDELKSFEDTKQMAQQARELGQMCQMVQGENFDCAVVHISQVRVDLGSSSMHKPMKPTGGKGTGHHDSLRIKLFSSKSESKAIMGTVEGGVEERIGTGVTWSIDKNKLNGRYGVGTYDLYVRGENVGVDRASELLDYGMKYGIITGSTWLTIYDEKFQGAKNTKAYIRENPEIAAKLEADILAKSI